MKKLLLIFLLFFAQLSIAQNHTHIDYTSYYYDWVMMTEQTGSAYIKVIRSDNLYKVGYQYQVLIFSNSYKNGYLTSTYFTNMKLYIQEYNHPVKYIYRLNYILIQPKTSQFNGVNVAFSFYNYCGNLRVQVRWDKMIAY